MRRKEVGAHLCDLVPQLFLPTLLEISLPEVLLPQSWLSASHKQCRTPTTGAANSNTFGVSQVTDVTRLKMLNYIVTWECREKRML